jgi:hypothetical protein
VTEDVGGHAYILPVEHQTTTGRLRSQPREPVLY